MAGDWLCRGVDVCLRHCHPLMPLWESSRPVNRDDAGARLAEILPDLLAGNFDSDLIEPSAYDAWLDRRLSQGEDKTWLATQPLFAAMTCCALLGKELLRAQELEADDRAEKAKGFDAASRGPEEITCALDGILLAGEGDTLDQNRHCRCCSRHLVASIAAMIALMGFAILYVGIC
ncbi:hypothetical protein KUW17_19525 [Leisingera aquaemixtae]|uniref:hypothetical protein n=1 Tax=Leisingera aquaemixtae TaxID=1396826 RepID=UPI001C9532DE|nr:hypothetical protein [Leisingera aquaemixtae]MBY6068942.1 hypothetical protein [Leisingera aquaemixtae]